MESREHENTRTGVGASQPTQYKTSGRRQNQTYTAMPLFVTSKGQVANHVSCAFAKLYIASKKFNTQGERENYIKGLCLKQ